MILSRLAHAARASLFGGIAVVAGACSSPDAGPKYPDVNSFCNGRATAECNAEVLASCGSPDQATCIAKRQALCVTERPPTGAYTPASAELCVNVVSSAYADAKLTLDESNAVRAACDPVFDGAGLKNAVCGVDANCQQSTGLRCVLSAGSTLGTCQLPRQVMGGGSCASPDLQCVSGYHCGSTAHCDIDAALGESCGAVPCAPGLLCSAAGTCQSKAPDGTVCASDDECLHGICNRASAAAMGLCVSQISLAPTEPFCVDTR